ncbi:hypothetical protein OTB20_28845 [Streptomyces sp. H27-H1]|uniref:hypothetical protein n=1 Tax=Streptomyces sp. H27-H1 TaxID=2996461 RepID=UPI00226F4A6A|nr:hypothetical protein [Streptomyces sp. H27-H1]MCY0930128.1 hypothetical protein [Streptomyces sp. H27-H1]
MPLLPVGVQGLPERLPDPRPPGPLPQRPVQRRHRATPRGRRGPVRELRHRRLRGREGGLWVKKYPGSPLAAVTATFDVKVAGPDGYRFQGTVTAVDQQPRAPFLYPAPSATAAPIDEVAAVLDQVADHIRTEMAPGQQMRPQSFRQWIRTIDRGAVQLVGERGPSQAGRSAVAAFVADFPKVRIEVSYEAAAARAGGCGYADATARPGGTWLKVFPAAR